MAKTNKAPRFHWRIHSFSDRKRRRLFVEVERGVHTETPFFIDTAHRAYARTFGEKHSLFGSGMSETGAAKILGFGPRLDPLKHRAEQRAIERIESRTLWPSIYDSAAAA